MLRTNPLLLFSVLIVLFGHESTMAQDAVSVWAISKTSSGASLRGLFVVDANVIWASGSAGTVLKSVDGGEAWQSVGPPDTEKLDFRDVHAFDENRAVIASAGTPSRIYTTVDGGSSWQPVFEDSREAVFFDALSFRNDGQGVIFGDPIDGRLLLIRSGDWGKTWRELDRGQQPVTLENEAGFAASGTCLCLTDDRLYIGLGGGSESRTPRNARIMYSDDWGGHWEFVDSPLPSGPASGVFSLAFANRDHGVAVGGNYTHPDDAGGNACYTTDGGAHWTTSTDGPGGYRSCVAVRYINDGFQFVCVGPTGSDLSVDGGQSWQPLDETGFHAVAFSPDGRLGVATGAEGRIGIWKE